MITEAERQALDRVVAVVNGKGGVGKTSITANVGAELASRGQKVLVIDLDRQGNLRMDLGFAKEDTDQGKSTVDAVWMDQQFTILTARPNLDYIAGGRALDMLTALARSSDAESLPHESVPEEFAAKLATIAGNYDLILIDGAPGIPELQDMALAAARWVLVPTRTDPASLEGLTMLGPRVKKARVHNPNLTYLGSVLGPTQSTASNVRASAEESLAVLGDVVPLFDSYIRYYEPAAESVRRRGQAARELADDVRAARATRLRLLRRAKNGEDVTAELETASTGLPNSAIKLAADYAALTDEIIERIAKAEA